MTPRRISIGILAVSVVIVGIGVGVERWIESTARERVALTLGRLSRFGNFSFQDVDLVWTRRALRVEGLDVKLDMMTAPLHVGSVLIRNVDREHPVPQFMDVTFEDIAIPKQDLAAFDSVPAGLVGDEVPYANLDISYRYDPIEHGLELRDLTLGVPGMGTLGLRLQLRDLDLEVMPRTLDWASAMSALSSASTVLLQRFEVSYQDDGLASKFVVAMAVDSGTLLEDELNQLPNEIAKIRAESGNPNTIAASRALADFLETPGTIRLELAPPIPIPMLRLVEGLNDPSSLLSALQPAVTSVRGGRALADAARAERAERFDRTERAAAAALDAARWEEAIPLISDLGSLIDPKREEEFDRVNALSSRAHGRSGRDASTTLRPGEEAGGCQLSHDGELTCGGKRLDPKLRVPHFAQDGTQTSMIPDRVEVFTRSPSGRYAIVAACDDRCDWYYKADFVTAKLAESPLPIYTYDVIWPKNENVVVGIGGEGGDVWIAVASESDQKINSLDFYSGCRAVDVFPVTATWRDLVHVSMEAEFACCPEKESTCSWEKQTRRRFSHVELDTRSGSARTLD